MRGLSLLALVFLLGIGTSAPIPKAIKKARSDRELLEGIWETVTMDLDGQGQKPQPGDLGTMTIEIKDGTYSSKTNSGPGFKQVAMTLDETTTPKRFSLGANGPSTCYRIYELDGDTLRECENYKDWPTSFTGGNGSHSFVWKRVKE